MGRNPLDLHRKLRKYIDNIKLVKRGIQIRKSIDNNRSLENPDFGVGTYQVKSNTQYTLILNVDIPKSKSNNKNESSIYVDTWGISHPHNRLHHISQSKINLVNRDVRIRFQTYPKTRFIAFTFYGELGEVTQYNLNYVYIDSKNPIPRNSVTPGMPSKFSVDFNLELNPRTLEAIELKSNVLYDFRENINLDKINLDVFENQLINYLLQKETSPEYVSALKYNIKHCNTHGDFYPAISLSDIAVNPKSLLTKLKSMRSEIMKKAKDLEKIMGKIDNLSYHKSSLEAIINQSETGIPYQKKKYENYLEILKDFYTGLNLKYNNIKELKNINNINKKLSEVEIKNVDLVLDYYLKRIDNDKRKIEKNIRKAETDWNEFQKNTLNPIDTRQNSDQARLDRLLVYFRDYQKNSLEIKSELDKMIVNFIISWYKWIQLSNKNTS
tara:strand:+ start:6911 stop:8230 length:1320 start_codon:yes stop_codon:yes gene_type:complete